MSWSVSQRPTDRHQVIRTGSVRGLFAGHDLVTAATPYVTCETSSTEQDLVCRMNQVYQ